MFNVIACLLFLQSGDEMSRKDFAVLGNQAASSVTPKSDFRVVDESNKAFPNQAEALAKMLERPKLVFKPDGRSIWNLKDSKGDNWEHADRAFLEKWVTERNATLKSSSSKPVK